VRKQNLGGEALLNVQRLTAARKPL